MLNTITSSQELNGKLCERVVFKLVGMNENYVCVCKICGVGLCLLIIISLWLFKSLWNNKVITCQFLHNRKFSSVPF